MCGVGPPGGATPPGVETIELTQSRTIVAAVVTLLVGSWVFGSWGENPTAKTNTEQGVRVGIFDSRAVATAYYRSAQFKKELATLKAEYQKATDAGNQTRMRALEAQGIAQQELAHKQGFGTCPVDDILQQIHDELPQIADACGVDVMVSQWDITYQRPGVAFTDVTRVLLCHWNPSAETLALIDQFKAVAPIPHAELSDAKDNAPPKDDQR